MQKRVRHHTNIYHNNFWRFSKQVCNGGFKNSATKAGFSKEATAFIQLLFESPDPPPFWSQSKIAFIYKSGDSQQPSNFRMISVTPCVSNVFHQILTTRTVSYATDNKYINNECRKAFKYSMASMGALNIIGYHRK